MFDMELGEELTLIQDTVRRFANERLAGEYREFEQARAIPDAILTEFSGLGLSGLELPEHLNGAGLGALARSVVLEELAAGDAGSVLALDGIGAAQYALSELGGEDALESYILPLLDDPHARALLVWHDETFRGAAALKRNVRNRDSLSGGEPSSGGTYDGCVPWVPAESAELIVILDPLGASVIRSGFKLKPLKGSGLRASGGAELEFIDAPIVERWENKTAAARALARWQLYTAALLVGVMRIAAETSRQYAMERVAFGKPIAHHQALAFLIADMHTAVDGSRIMVQEAAWRADNSLPFESAAALAFIEAVESAMFVTPNALQIFGGQGFMQDLPLEKYMREARTLGLMSGGIDLAKAIAGDSICATEGKFEFSPIMSEEV